MKQTQVYDSVASKGLYLIDIIVNSIFTFQVYIHFYVFLAGFEQQFYITYMISLDPDETPSKSASRLDPNYFPATLYTFPCGYCKTIFFSNMMAMMACCLPQLLGQTAAVEKLNQD